MDRTNIDPSHLIMDDDGWTWYWDGVRMFALEQDFDDDCGDPYAFTTNRGYVAGTWAEAVQWLVTDGYISKEQASEEIEKG